jgi:beta-lactamase class A
MKSSIHVLLLLLGLLLGAAPAHAAERGPAAREYLGRIQPSAELQSFLDAFVQARLARDPALARSDVRVAVLDLTQPDEPRLAHHHGEVPIYPASVVKFVYLLAAYAFQEAGRLQFDPALEQSITEMIRVSSNHATQQVFARVTGTQPGPELGPEAYAEYRERKLAVERWLQGLGIMDLHTVNPTYDGGGDISGREDQFLSDASVPGALPGHGSSFKNRTGMTAIGTAKLLALLATDRALSPENSATARQRMKRDSRQQRHLAARIAGGAERVGGLEVYAKSGTWGPIYADAGIVHHPSGRELVVAVFTEGRPPYRGDFIADLTEAVVRKLLVVQGREASAQ